MIHERVPLFDRAKGIGIILLVLGHTVYYDGIVFSAIFSFHMPLFFFLSGMFLKEEKNVKELVLKYATPFVFFTTIWGGIVFILRNLTESIQYPKEIFRIVAQFVLKFGIDELWIGNIWFLAMLPICLIIVRQINIFLKSNIFGNRKCQNLSIIVILMIESYYCAKITFIVPFLLKLIPMCVLFVFIGNKYGNLIVEYVISKKGSFQICVLVLLFLVLQYSNAPVNLGIPKYNDMFLYVLCALLGISLTIYVSKSKLPFFVEYIGKNSLIFFATEQAIRTIVIKAYNLFSGEQYESMLNIPLLQSLMFTLITLLVAGLICYLIKPLYLKFELLSRSTFSY